MRNLWRLTALVCLCVTRAIASPETTESPSLAPNAAAPEELRYLAEPYFAEKSSSEVRLSAGYDYTDPYLEIFSGQLSGHRQLGDLFKAGLELTLFGHRPRASFLLLQREFGPYGFAVSPSTPRLSAAASLRFTPLSGLVNWFSSDVWLVELGILARSGVIRYAEGTGPLAGLGLDLQLTISAPFALHASLLWDMEKPGASWQSRVGFRVGPSWNW